MKPFIIAYLYNKSKFSKKKYITWWVICHPLVESDLINAINIADINNNFYWYQDMELLAKMSVLN